MANSASCKRLRKPSKLVKVRGKPLCPAMNYSVNILVSSPTKLRLVFDERIMQQLALGQLHGAGLHTEEEPRNDDAEKRPLTEPLLHPPSCNRAAAPRAHCSH